MVDLPMRLRTHLERRRNEDFTDVEYRRLDSPGHTQPTATPHNLPLGCARSSVGVHPSRLTLGQRPTTARTEDIPCRPPDFESTEDLLGRTPDLRMRVLSLIGQPAPRVGVCVAHVIPLWSPQTETTCATLGDNSPQLLPHQPASQSLTDCCSTFFSSIADVGGIASRVP